MAAPAVGPQQSNQNMHVAALAPASDPAMQSQPVHQVAPGIFLIMAQVQDVQHEWVSMLAQPRPAPGIFPMRKDYFDSSSIDELNYILILYL